MWKQIKNTIYEISTNGEIKNLKTNRLLKLYKQKKGYMSIGLTHNGTKKTYLVHRLVAEAFIDNYSNELDVHHVNGIRYDNRLSNLECVTKLFNSEERVFMLYYLDEIEIIVDIINMNKNNITPEEIYSKLRDKAKLLQNTRRNIG